MTDPAGDKTFIAAFLDAIADPPAGGAAAVLERFCHPDAVWRIFHPFGRIEGTAAIAERFWDPLETAFPDHEHRIGFLTAGDYEGARWVSTLGHLMGTFSAPWLGLPPTHALSFLRFALNAEVRDGKIAQAYVLFDFIDLMRQAGHYPFRRMPGSAEQWPMAPLAAGGPLGHADPVQGAETMRIVREMQVGLPKGDELKALKNERGKHSEHWHKNMNWYGPAGIGSARGQRGFTDYHGVLFIQAFPDRAGVVREPQGAQERPGHYVRVGDGRFAVTAGWPSLHGTHLGGGWLGLPPSGRKVEMRVADWYRIDADDKIIDNWVMIDIVHICDQIGLDLLADLKHFADPALPRWPQ